MSHSGDVDSFLSVTGPESDEILREMERYASEREFPIIGPHSGGLLRALASMTDATDVFEFGSGFGYSAYWLLRGMSEEGTVVLTELDGDDIALAEELFEKAGVADRAIFERGDAMDVVDRYEGPFDVVLIDHQKETYPAAFEKVRSKVAVGGVVAADNVMREPVVEHIATGGELQDDESTRGLVEYLDAVRAADDFDTVVLPVGKGVSLTVRRR